MGDETLPSESPVGGGKGNFQRGARTWPTPPHEARGGGREGGMAGGGGETL